MQQKENPSRKRSSMWNSKDEREKLHHCMMKNVLWQAMNDSKKAQNPWKQKQHSHLMEYATKEFYSWQEGNYFP